MDRRGFLMLATGTVVSPLGNSLVHASTRLSVQREQVATAASQRLVPFGIVQAGLYAGSIAFVDRDTGSFYVRVES